MGVWLRAGLGFLRWGNRSGFHDFIFQTGMDNGQISNGDPDCGSTNNEGSDHGNVDSN
jgi:hypothetical protein